MPKKVIEGWRLNLTAEGQQDEEIPEETAITGLVAGGQHKPGGLRAEVLQRGE